MGTARTCKKAIEHVDVNHIDLAHLDIYDTICCLITPPLPILSSNFRNFVRLAFLVSTFSISWFESNNAGGSYFKQQIVSIFVHDWWLNQTIDLSFICCKSKSTSKSSCCFVCLGYFYAFPLEMGDTFSNKLHTWDVLVFLWIFSVRKWTDLWYCFEVWRTKIGWSLKIPQFLTYEKW